MKLTKLFKHKVFENMNPFYEARHREGGEQLKL